MKRSLSFFSVALALAGVQLLMAGAFTRAQQNPNGQNTAVAPLSAPRPGFTFPARQTFTYAVDWRVFPAATAVLHLEADGTKEHLTATADTIGAINLLFHVSDKFQSTFDRDKGCTAEFDKQAVEGRRQINSTLKMDYARASRSWTKKISLRGRRSIWRPEFQAV